MAAPKGNRFWELRSKHGRDKLFETPELIWEAACEYFDWCENNPLISVEYHSGKRRQVPKMRPFTMHGLCAYLDCNIAYFRTFKAQLPETDKDFNTVISKIEEIVYNQKFSGAAAGFLNANIIARDLGLQDSVRQDLTTNGKSLNAQINIFPPNAKEDFEIKEGE